MANAEIAIKIADLPEVQQKIADLEAKVEWRLKCAAMDCSNEGFERNRIFALLHQGESLPRMTLYVCDEHFDQIMRLLRGL